MRRLFFLVIVLLLASFVFSTVDNCNVYTNKADCNDIGGGFWCSNQPPKDGEGNDLRCRCIFEEGEEFDCVISESQEIDVSKSNIQISNGFIHLLNLEVESGAKLHLINDRGFSNQANFLDNAGFGGAGGGSYGKRGGNGGVGGKIAAYGKSGSFGSGGTGGGNAASSSPGAAVGFFLNSLVLNGEISVSGKNSAGGGSCTSCSWDDWGDTAGGGGGAGGTGGGLLVIHTNAYSGSGKLTANGGNGGGGGHGCTTCLSLHSGGGGGGGGGGSGGRIYFNNAGGGSQPVGAQLEVTGGSGGSGSYGINSADDGTSGFEGEEGLVYRTNEWDINDFLDLTSVSLAESIEVDLTKFWDYPENFENNAMDQSRLSKAWMRGFPYHTVYQDSSGNNVMEVTRKYAPVMFYADFIGSTSLSGIVETRPPYETSSKIIDNYQGVSSGTMLMTEASVKQHFYEGGPVVKTMNLNYDPDIFAPSEIITFNKRLDGSEIKTVEKTIFDKKNLIMGYRGSKSEEIFGINPSLTNKIDGIERYVDDHLVSRDEIVYMVLDVDTGLLKPLSFYTASVTVGLMNPTNEYFVVSCSFPSRDDNCWGEAESPVVGAPYSFVYEVYSDKTDFWCLRSSDYLDISSWITECDVKFGRQLPENYLIVPKRTNKFFDSNILFDGLESLIYSEILEFDNFGRPLRARNFDGSITNLRRDDRGRIVKSWMDGLTSEENPEFENFYNKYGFLEEQKIFSSNFSNLYFYDDNLLLEITSFSGDNEDSPTAVYEYDLETLPKKYITKSKVSEGVYAEEIIFKDVNGVVLQKQAKSSGNEYVVKMLAYQNGKLWREYSPFSASTSGDYVSEVPSGLEFKEYDYADDPTERIISIKYEDGNIKTYDYSAYQTSTGFIPQVTVTEPNSARTRYTFDLSNNLLMVEQSSGDIYDVVASWEDNLNTEKIIDPLGRSITVVKDGHGNILEKEHFDSGEIVLSFDEVFRTESMTNPLGTEIEFFYREGTNVLSSQVMDRNEDFGPIFNCVNSDCGCSSDDECLNGFTCQGGSCQ